MDFQISEEQKERADAVLQFAREALTPGARERAAAHRFDRALWDQAAEMGLAGLPVPEEWGGLGLSALDTMLVVEALGKGSEDLGIVFALSAHMFACAVPLWKQGSPAQHERWLRDVAAGKLIAANAISEPGSGSDVHAMKTTAVKDGDFYRLNGGKCFVTNAPVADLFVTYAVTAPEKGYFGITAFLVPKGTPGMTVLDAHAKTGLCTSTWGEVFFDDCRVPVSLRLGKDGAGALIFRDSMIWERGCLFGFYVGAMERALETAVEQAKTRVQFGQPIGHFQSIQNRIVDMKLRLETSRLLLYRAGWLHGQGKRCDEAVALAKIWISECAVQSGLDLVQIFGGSGVVADNGIDTLLRDALPGRIFSGSNEMQRTIVARHLGLK